jgi:hypothetical protein
LNSLLELLNITMQNRYKDRVVTGMQPSTQASKPLTLQQLCFANSLIRGGSQIQAYREAYPADTSNPANQHCSAYRLSRHPQIQVLLKDTHEAVAEVLSEDMQATKRYALKKLFALSKQSSQESTKLKALELLGKASGMFSPIQPSEVPVSAYDLKKALRQRLVELEGVI